MPVPKENEEFEKESIASLKLHIKEGSKIFFKFTTQYTYQVFIIVKYGEEDDIQWITYRLACLLGLPYDYERERIRGTSAYRNYTMQAITHNLAIKLGIHHKKLNYGRI